MADWLGFSLCFDSFLIVFLTGAEVRVVFYHVAGFLCDLCFDDLVIVI